MKAWECRERPPLLQRMVSVAQQTPDKRFGAVPTTPCFVPEWTDRPALSVTWGCQCHSS